ncbi:kinase-like domain-containing protein, partial [Gigaspora rosea]
LNKQPYTKASDIYSFGIIMWEILYELMLQVCNGLRPYISESIVSCYADLMKKCWHAEQEKRTTAAEICDIFAEWQNSENIYQNCMNLIKNYKT